MDDVGRLLGRLSIDRSTITRLIDPQAGERVTISGDTLDVGGVVSTQRTGDDASSELARWFPMWEAPDDGQ